ncbi:MAG: ABC transporter permease, partial [Deltaproteobacteria bacterium]|nr:ABC transporter permease [Deltaproteobacteria bacterium]
MFALLYDLRQALRSLAKAPLFTVAATLTLALGIGLDSAMLTVFDRLLLRPLPFGDLETLVGVYEADTQLGWTHNVVSAPNFVDLQRQATQFEAMAAYGSTIANLSDEGDALRVRAGRVSHSFFPILRVRPLLGRNFTADEDRSGGPRAVILGDEFWNSHFGGDPTIVGRTIRLEGVPHQVVGVLPPGFHVGGRFPGRVYLPMSFTAQELADRARHAYGAIGRLKPGVTVAAADAELKRIALGLATLYPETNANGSATVSPLLDDVTQGSVPYATLFISLASFLLLIACANVSNLILARGAARQLDLAVRTALGASRGALIRRMAADSGPHAVLVPPCAAAGSAPARHPDSGHRPRGDRGRRGHRQLHPDVAAVPRPPRQRDAGGIEGGPWTAAAAFSGGSAGHPGRPLRRASHRRGVDGAYAHEPAGG